MNWTYGHSVLVQRITSDSEGNLEHSSHALHVQDRGK